MKTADVGASIGYDLYPVLEMQFNSDPGMDYIDVKMGDSPAARVRRITRDEFEQERLVRDAHRLNRPIRSQA